MYFSEMFHFTLVRDSPLVCYHETNKSNKSLSTGPVFDKMLKTNKQINKPFFVALITLYIVLLEAF